MLYYERKFSKLGRDIIIGVDEAGRGPLAGPVVAAAVYLKTFNFLNRIDDSKKLSSFQRLKSFHELVEKSVFGIGVVSEAVIDRINILTATQCAMEQAVGNLLRRLPKIEESRIHLLVDGPTAFSCSFPITCIINGDAKSKSIAAASIVAKTIRDRIMDIYDKILPAYGFKQHKGYATQCHRQAIAVWGLSFFHRKSFCCV
ncbi:MAG: ribonuclease HII [Candidatus Omnitrophica bacterium]|nr:ribonuclease HII [Candidatus Omnitrophota bacterium]